MRLLLAQLAIPGVEAKSHGMRKWHQKNGSCQNLYTTFPHLTSPSSHTSRSLQVYWREVSRCFSFCQQCPTKADSACKRAMIKAGEILSDHKDLSFEHETAEQSRNMANLARSYAELRYIVDLSVPSAKVSREMKDRHRRESRKLHVDILKLRFLHHNLCLEEYNRYFRAQSLWAHMWMSKFLVGYEACIEHLKRRIDKAIWRIWSCSFVEARCARSWLKMYGNMRCPRFLSSWSCARGVGPKKMK